MEKNYLILICLFQKQQHAILEIWSQKSFLLEDHFYRANYSSWAFDRLCKFISSLLMIKNPITSMYFDVTENKQSWL